MNIRMSIRMKILKFKTGDLIRGIDTEGVGDAIIQVTSVTDTSYDLKWIYPDQDNREEDHVHDFIDGLFKTVPEWYLKERTK